jgi:hypothetical protein
MSGQLIEKENVMSTAFIDFAKLKESVRIEQIVSMLGLAMKKQGDQMRGPCTQCRSGGDRALAVNIAKGSFYCFAEKKGGDLISLCAHITGKPQRDAAEQIATHFRFAGDSSPVSPAPQAPKSGPQKEKAGINPLIPLSYLETTHEALPELGVSPEIMEEYGAGYAPRGTMRGRFLIPIHNRNGVLLAYCGYALKGEAPRILYPSNFDPSTVIFNAHRVSGNLLLLVRGPLDVLQVSDFDDPETGRSAVCFLTETVSAQQLEQLASLLDEKKMESIVLL